MHSETKGSPYRDRARTCACRPWQRPGTRTAAKKGDRPNGLAYHPHTHALRKLSSADRRRRCTIRQLRLPRMLDMRPDLVDARPPAGETLSRSASRRPRSRDIGPHRAVSRSELRRPFGTRCPERVDDRRVSARLTRKTTDGRHSYCAVQPPSTNSDAPVMKDDAGEARKTTAPASSSSSPQRPIGIFLTNS